MSDFNDPFDKTSSTQNFRDERQREQGGFDAIKQLLTAGQRDIQDIKNVLGSFHITGDGGINVDGNVFQGFNIHYNPNINDLSNALKPFLGFPWLAYAIDDTASPSDGYDVVMGATSLGSTGSPSPITQFSLQVNNPNDNTADQLRLFAGIGQGRLEFKSNNAGSDSAVISCATNSSVFDFKSGTNEINGSVAAGNTHTQILLTNGTNGSTINLDTDPIAGRNAAWFTSTDGGGTPIMVFGYYI